jgi:UDP-N-acetylglucosamine--N-acetylmuramyl-(pentapeptide) pyrophosphoryl-undecaprenol N-acetylglucosamine transferase
VKRPVVIAGGGTGGHVFVARAISQALERRGVVKGELRFVGSARGQERELLADTGVQLELLAGRGIKRSLAPRALLDNLGALLGIVRAFLRSLSLLKAWRPRAVVSVGGFAAAPVGFAAVLRRCPLILVNIDAIPGLTHRALSRFATASCVAVPGTPLRNPHVTGIPVRQGFTELDRSEEGRRAARRALGCDPDRAFVAVVTGSLGARSVNQAVMALAAAWPEFSGTIYHVTGRRDAAELEGLSVSTTPGLEHRLVAFEDQMTLLYQASDVAITRAGALTCGELAVAGLPAVLVPLPGAPGDHQTKNARALTERGAGILVPDDQLSAEGLRAVLDPLLGDPARRKAMEDAARALGHPQAADEVAEVVLDHVA